MPPSQMGIPSLMPPSQMGQPVQTGQPGPQSLNDLLNQARRLRGEPTF
jgi:hypothetical protein